MNRHTLAIRLWIVGVLAALLLPTQKTKAAHLEAFDMLPLHFIENAGQLEAKVRYYARAGGRTLFLADDGLSIRLSGPRCPESGNCSLKISPHGTARDFEVIADSPLRGRFNRFYGDDPAGWRTNIPAFGSVVYSEVYPRVDLKFYGNGRELEYDVIVRKGGDPSRVSFLCSGVIDLELEANGDLSMVLASGEVLIQKKPDLYQEISGKRVKVNGSFRIENEDGGGSVYGFEVGPYDRDHPLIIDPVITYSTFLGGASTDFAHSVAVDSSGNVYVAGWTESADYPLKNPFRKAYEGEEFDYVTDVFVTKLDASGKELIYSTFLGGTLYRHGNAADVANGIAVDDAGNAYITGYTNSAEFPVKRPIQAKVAGGNDVFVVKFNASGDALLYATCLGGGKDDYGAGIAVDGAGCAYVTGYTASSDFPVRNAVKAKHRGGFDAFLFKISAAGDTLDFCSYLGGKGNDFGTAVAVYGTAKGKGGAFVCGHTESDDFPVKDALQKSFAGPRDAFITGIDTTKKTLEFSTYLGGNSEDYAYAIALDAASHVYVTGKTKSMDFPLKNPFQEAKGLAYDAFVSVIDVSDAELVWSTFLGGDGADWGRGIALDKSGLICVAGETRSKNFPTKNPLKEKSAGRLDIFVARLKASDGKLNFSSYFGGSSYDNFGGMALDDYGNIYLTGWTRSEDFPTSKGAFQEKKAKASDVFVVKIGK